MKLYPKNNFANTFSLVAFLREKAAELLKKKNDRILLDLQNDVLDKDREIEVHLATIARVSNDRDKLTDQLTRLAQDNDALLLELEERRAEVDHFEEEKENLLQIVQQLAQIGNPNLNFKSQSLVKASRNANINNIANINTNDEVSINNNRARNDVIDNTDVFKEEGFEIPVMIKEDSGENTIDMTESSVDEQEADELGDDLGPETVRIARGSLLADLERSMTSIWPEADAEDMESSLIEAVRKERNDLGLNVKLEATIEQELDNYEIAREERENTDQTDLELIWEDGIKQEMETSLLEKVRKERNDQGLNAKLEAALHQELDDEDTLRVERENPVVLDKPASMEKIWEEEIQADMESSLLNSIRKERHDQGLNARLEAEVEDELAGHDLVREDRAETAVLFEPSLDNILEDSVEADMESSLLAKLRRERHSLGKI